CLMTGLQSDEEFRADWLAKYGDKGRDIHGDSLDQAMAHHTEFREYFETGRPDLEVAIGSDTLLDLGSLGDDPDDPCPGYDFSQFPEEQYWSDRIRALAELHGLD